MGHVHGDQRAHEAHGRLEELLRRELCEALQLAWLGLGLGLGLGDAVRVRLRLGLGLGSP